MNYGCFLIIFRFERHRVIIRKGHVGRRFYVIYSGSVAFTFNEDDAEVFSKQPGYYTMGKGDAFGVGFYMYLKNMCLLKKINRCM